MEITYLDPQTLQVESAPDGTLRVTVPGDRSGLRAEVLRALPLSHPEEQIVLRDGGNKELGILRDLRDLPAATADLLREALRRRYFLPRITRIMEVYERFGTSVWNVDTDRGAISVTTRAMNEAVHEVEAGRYLITDVENNRYEIKNLSELDADSRARFMGKI